MILHNIVLMKIIKTLEFHTRIEFSKYKFPLEVHPCFSCQSQRTDSDMITDYYGIVVLSISTPGGGFPTRNNKMGYTAQQIRDPHFSNSTTRSFSLC